MRRSSGRASFAIVTTPDVGLEVGQRFLVLGNSLLAGEPGITFLEVRTSRRPNTVTAPRRTNRDPIPVDAVSVS